MSALLALPLSVASAQDTTWNVGTGNWATGGNWTTGTPPAAGDDATIDNGGTAQVTANADVQDVFLGSGTGLSGSLDVTGATLSIGGDLTVGGFLGNGGEGFLTIGLGGVVNTSGIATVGLTADSSGQAEVLGGTWTINGLGFNVGINGGAGTVLISQGGDVVASAGTATTIGFGLGGSGTMTVSGAGSTFQGSSISIGSSTEGFVVVEDEASLTTDGSSFILGEEGGIGNLRINTGADVLHSGQDFQIGGVGSYGAVIADGLGSTLDVSTTAIVVGWNGGEGYLAVQNEAVVSSLGGLIADGDPGSVGTVLVTGTGSEWNSSSGITVGVEGSGTATVQNGGKISSLTTSIGGNVGSSGVATVSGTGSVWESSGNFTVASSGTGTLLVEDGGVASGVQGYVGLNAGSVAEVLVTGTGSQWQSTDLLSIGHNGAALLTIENGGKVTNVDGYIAFNPTGTAQVFVTGTGSEWVSSGSLIVSGTGRGALTIVDGGVVSSVSAHIGEGAGSFGEVVVTGTGSEWNDIGSFISVGSSGTGNLIVVDGAKVTSSEGYIGLYGSGTAIVSGTGSEWTSSAHIGVGDEGTGTLGVLYGGKLTSAGGGTIGYAVTGSGTVVIQGAGAEWDAQSTVDVAQSGTGTLYLVDEGLLTVGGGAGNVLLATNAGSVGLITIGYQDTAAGVLAAGSVTFGAGQGTLRFDHNDEAYSFGADLIGAGLLDHTGSGETILVGSNGGFVGTANILNGTLTTTATDSLGSATVALQGGVLNPQGGLGVGRVDWSGGQIAFDLTSPSPDQIAVTNALSNLGGGEFLLETTPELGVAYTLISFGSTDFLDSDFTATFVNPNVVFETQFVVTAANNGEVQMTVLSATAFGGILQNSNPVNVPTFADFLVIGPVTTGTPSESNIINSLIFDASSSLLVFNNLTVTSGILDVAEGSASLNGGTVITPGNLEKTGAGELVTNTNLLVGGAANINEGALIVNGQLSANAGITVFQNALLGGSGVINGNVVNSGFLSPGNSPGTLTINGNYTQTSSGTFLLEIASPSVYDRLIVSGNASLSGTLAVLASNLKYGQQSAFLQAGSISGEFDQILVSNPDRFRGRFLAEGGTGTLVIAPTSYTLVAETTNQRNVAEALDSYIPASGNDRETVSIALDLLSEDEYPAAFDQIAPSFHESLANITIEQAFAMTQQINQRLSAVRLGARGFQAIGIESPLVHDKDGKSVAEAKDLKSNVEAIADTRWNTWVMGNGLFGRVTNVSQVPNYNFNSGGFLVGVDYAWSENFVTGLYGGYQYTYADYNNAGNTQINSALFGGYATYDVGGFYADAVVGGGYNGYRARRGIEFSSIDRTARSQPNGGQFNAALNLGYDWEVGKFTFGPIAGVQYTYAGVAPFTETGADSLDLRVAQQNANSLRTTFGGRVAYTWNITETIALIPEVRMFWQHEFLNNPRNISSALDGGSGPTFGYETSAPARDSVFAGAGVSAQFGKNWNAFFFYNADFGRQDYTGHMVSGGVNWKF